MRQVIAAMIACLSCAAIAGEPPRTPTAELKLKLAIVKHPNIGTGLPVTAADRKAVADCEQSVLRRIQETYPFNTETVRTFSIAHAEGAAIPVAIVTAAIEVCLRAAEGLVVERGASVVGLHVVPIPR